MNVKFLIEETAGSKEHVVKAMNVRASPSCLLLLHNASVKSRCCLVVVASISGGDGGASARNGYRLTLQFPTETKKKSR